MNNSAEEFEAPDRGEQITHGTNQDFDYPADTDTQPEKLAEPDWSEDNPIPVYIVNTPEVPQISDSSYERFIIVDSSVEIAGKKRNRTRMIVKNESQSTAEVYIDKSQAVTTAFSFRLNAGDELELKHNDSVWARCDTGDTATVSVVQEYNVPLDVERHV